jgi:hypothetical protein
MSKKSEEAARAMDEWGVAWPDGNEDLFRLTEDERGHVLVRHLDSSYDRAEGFKRGGDALVDHCIGLVVGGSIEETMVLPQHFLDLANLKTVVNRVISYLSWTHDQSVERESQPREWEHEQQNWYPLGGHRLGSAATMVATSFWST